MRIPLTVFPFFGIAMEYLSCTSLARHSCPAKMSLPSYEQKKWQKVYKSPECINSWKTGHTPPWQNRLVVSFQPRIPYSLGICGTLLLVQAKNRGIRSDGVFSSIPTFPIWIRGAFQKMSGQELRDGNSQDSFSIPSPHFSWEYYLVPEHVTHTEHHKLICDLCSHFTEWSGRTSKCLDI